MPLGRGKTVYRGSYTGKVLRVDLTTKTFKEEPPPADVARKRMRDGMRTRAKLEELRMGQAADKLGL